MKSFRGLSRDGRTWGEPLKKETRRRGRVVEEVRRAAQRVEVNPSAAPGECQEVGSRPRSEGSSYRTWSHV